MGPPSAHWSPPPSAPPTLPGPLGPGERKAWPTVIGVISIVLAAFGILGACGGLVFPLFIPMLEQWLKQIGAPAQVTAQWNAMQAHLGLMVADNVVKLALSVLLLIAGIQLVRRRPAGVTMTWGWCFARLAGGLLSAFTAYTMQQAQFQGMRAAGGPTLPPAAANLAAFGGVAVGVIWAWAYPIFLMVWFSRAAVREEVRTWFPAGSPGGGP